MRALKLKKEQYLRRRKRSKKAFANKDEMRLCIFKSTNHIEAQIIDDFNQKTIVSASSKEKELSSATKTSEFKTTPVTRYAGVVVSLYK